MTIGQLADGGKQFRWIKVVLFSCTVVLIASLFLSSPFHAHAQTPTSVGPRAYVTNNQDNTVSVIDSGSNTVVATVPVGDQPRTVVEDSFNQEVYVGNTYGHSISVIDPTSDTVINTISLNTGFPLNFSLSSDGSRLYVAGYGDDQVYVIDTSTDKVVATLADGFVYPQNVLVNPAGTQLYVINTDNPCCALNNGYVSVIDTSNFSVITTITVGIAPNGVAISPDGTKLYVANQGPSNSNSTISVINTTTNTVVDTINVGINPTGLAINSDGSRLYVSNSNFGIGGYNDTVTGNVSVIDTATDSVINTITVGFVPNFLAISPDDTKVYVANTGGNPSGNTVSVIDTASNTVSSTITVGNQPWGIGFEKPLPLYHICPLFDQTEAVHSGAIIPIKLQLCDPQGNDLSASTIPVVANSVALVSTSAPGQLESPGNANPDNNFRYDATLGPTGGYIYNLGTTGFTTGTYALKFTAGSDPTLYAVQFEVK